MISQNKLIIAVDFDGTIVEDAYPGIGDPMLFAFETLKKLQEEGHRLILWTYRHGKRLDEAVEFCRNKGIEFYAINKSFPEENFEGEASRKIHADVFIDDRNIGGFDGWGIVYQQLSGKDIDQYAPRKKKKKGFFRF